jgi:hypothetical protein
VVRHRKVPTVEIVGHHVHEVEQRLHPLPVNIGHALRRAAECGGDVELSAFGQLQGIEGVTDFLQQ